MAPASASAMGVAAAFCLLSVALISTAAAAPSAASQWTPAAADSEWAPADSEEEQRVVREAEAYDADAFYADADESSLLHQENEEETLRAGAEQQQGLEEADELPEQEQQQQQKVWKPEDEGRLGRLNDARLNDTQQKQQDAEGEQRHQQTPASRQDDFGLVGRQEQGSRQGSQQWGMQPQPQLPPRDYNPLNHFGYFKVYVTPRGWLEALLTCASEGARLAVPRSAEEARAVGALYGASKARVQKAQDRELFFVGASDLLKEGEFVTLIGTKFNNGQYHQWQKGEPNNHGKNEHCVLSNDKGLYWDGNCAKKFAFVCEFKDPCKNSPRGDNIQQPQPQWPSQSQPQPQWPQQPQSQQNQQQEWQQQQQQQQQQWKQPQQQQQWAQG